MVKKYTYLIIGCISLFCVGAPLVLWAISEPNRPNDDTVSGTGQVVFLTLEGGFFGIVADDGGYYDPINLPDEFKIHGLSIVFVAKILHDVGSIHMWGEIVEVIYINYN